MEAEFAVAALAMKEAAYRANMMQKLGFGETFKCVPFLIDIISSSCGREPHLQLAC